VALEHVRSLETSS